MINLSEEWKKAYADYLEEAASEESFSKLFTELTEAREEYTKSFALLSEYYAIYAESEGIEGALLEAGGAAVGETKASGDEKEVNKTIKDLLMGVVNSGMSDQEKLKISDYMPMASYSVEKIGDMKFPGNLIFFLGQLIKWIRNVVIYFFEKIRNMIRGFLGKEPVELNPEALKLNLQKAKKIEGTTTSFIATKSGLLQNVSEGQTIAQWLGIEKEKKPDQVTDKSPRLVTLDFSKDVEKLRILVQHFYDIFDNAYGSNNEKLFGTDDLRMILDLFRIAIDNLETGASPRYLTMGGRSTELELVSADKVKQNLVVTNQNLIELKSAYVQTASQIADMSKIINSKEVIMLTDLGVDFSLLSGTTYNGLISIISTIKPRLKEARRMERCLERQARRYRALVDELSGMQSQMVAIANVTYTSTTNRKVVDLLQAAKYMSDIIVLRLSALALYMKELKDVRDILQVLASGFKSRK